MDNWKTIEPNVWKPKDAGDPIIGLVVGKTPRDETTGLSARYQIKNERGMFLIWGSAVLDDRMQYVTIGSRVRITYNGKTKNKRNQDVNLFTVDIASEESQADELEGIEKRSPAFHLGT